MINYFDWLDRSGDWVLVALLVALLGYQAFMLRGARQECQRQQRLAEENYCWSILYHDEVEALRKRLAEVERRHRNLQEMYATATRQLLGKNYYIIEQHVRRKRAAE